MQLTKRIILGFALCFAGAGVFAQTANEIINKNIEAMGGRDKLSKLASVYEEMNTSVMGQEIPGKIWIINDKGMRTEMTIMGQKMITVVTKDTGWIVNPMMGNSTPQPLPLGQLKQSMGRLDLHGQFMDYVNKGYKATLLGKEAVNGKDAYKIQLSKTGEPRLVFFIDASSFYITKVSTDVNANGTTMTAVVVLSDYKKTPEGYLFPFQTNIEAGPTEVKSTITKITVNPSVDPALFQKP